MTVARRGSRRRVPLGSAEFELAPGRAARLRVPVSPFARRFIRSHRRVSALATATTRDDVSRARFVLLAPRRR